jgi:hypothetical protein
MNNEGICKHLTFKHEEVDFHVSGNVFKVIIVRCNDCNTIIATFLPQNIYCITNLSRCIDCLGEDIKALRCTNLTRPHEQKKL